jgi:hypothetical protein
VRWGEGWGCEGGIMRDIFKSSWYRWHPEEKYWSFPLDNGMPQKLKNNRDIYPCKQLNSGKDYKPYGYLGFQRNKEVTYGKS